MNERIRELAKQARIKDHWSIDEARYLTNYLDEKKFAQLIVRECISVVEGGNFLHDQAPTAVFARECSGAIKRHFGVEE